MLFEASYQRIYESFEEPKVINQIKKKFDEPPEQVSREITKVNKRKEGKHQRRCRNN